MTISTPDCNTHLFNEILQSNTFKLHLLNLKKPLSFSNGESLTAMNVLRLYLEKDTSNVHQYQLPTILATPSLLIGHGSALNVTVSFSVAEILLSYNPAWNTSSFRLQNKNILQDYFQESKTAVIIFITLEE